jgi:hypothetical protein
VYSHEPNSHYTHAHGSVAAGLNPRACEEPGQTPGPAARAVIPASTQGTSVAVRFRAPDTEPVA